MSGDCPLSREALRLPRPRSAVRLVSVASPVSARMLPNLIRPLATRLFTSTFTLPVMSPTSISAPPVPAPAVTAARSISACCASSRSAARPAFVSASASAACAVLADQYVRNCSNAFWHGTLEMESILALQGSVSLRCYSRRADNRSAAKRPNAWCMPMIVLS